MNGRSQKQVSEGRPPYPLPPYLECKWKTTHKQHSKFVCPMSAHSHKQCRLTGDVRTCQHVGMLMFVDVVRIDWCWLRVDWSSVRRDVCATVGESKPRVRSAPTTVASRAQCRVLDVRGG